MKKISRSILVFLLCTSLIATPAWAESVNQENVAINIAFAGVLFEDVGEREREKILNDLTGILQVEPTLNVMTHQDVLARLGEAEYRELLTTRSKQACADAARSLGVDYIFFGTLGNQSKDPNRVLLSGRYYRFDRQTGALFSIEILKFFDSFHEEIIKIKREFVTTIIPEQSGSFFTSWPVLLFFGITIVGVMALILRPGKTSLEGENNPGPIEN
jgi:hypothetical protein